MSPKIAIAFILLGCAILAVVNAERPYPAPPNFETPYQNPNQYKQNGRLRSITAPGSARDQCHCPCNKGGPGGDGYPGAPGENEDTSYSPPVNGISVYEKDSR